MSDKSTDPEKLYDIVRALNLIPYFRQHPNHTIMEAARDLGRKPAEIKQDLARLHATGVGTNTEEMFDLTYDYQAVDIREDQGINRALRLTPTEASTLLLMLESLENAPGLVDPAAVQSAAAKLRGIMDSRATAVYDAIATPDAEESAHQSLCAQAIEEGKQLNFLYYSPSSDTTRRRTVDPITVYLRDDDTYLEAYDVEAGHRTFRLDRMEDVVLSDQPAQRHASQLGDDFDFQRSAEILLRTDATWLVDYEPISLGADRGDGWIEATMRYGSDEWLIRFALSQGDRLAIVEPQELARAVTLRAESGLVSYAETSARK